MEASEIFTLLRGDKISSSDMRKTILTRDNFRSDEDWQKFNPIIVKKWGQLSYHNRLKFLTDIISGDFNNSNSNGIEIGWN